MKMVNKNFHIFLIFVLSINLKIPVLSVAVWPKSCENRSNRSDANSFLSVKNNTNILEGYKF